MWVEITTPRGANISVKWEQVNGSEVIIIAKSKIHINSLVLLVHIFLSRLVLLLTIP